jgi:hypothetical protein
MSETLAARDFVVDFLRKELVGPHPGHPAVQIDGRKFCDRRTRPDSDTVQAFFSG